MTNKKSRKKKFEKISKIDPVIEKKYQDWQERQNDKEKKAQEKSTKKDYVGSKGVTNHTTSSGFDPIFSQTTKKLTEYLPLLLDDYQDVLMNTYMSYKQQHGKKNADGLAKLLIDAGRDFMLKSDTLFGGFNHAMLNDTAKQRVEQLMELYIPFDENKLQKAIDKKLSKVGYITTNLINNMILQPMGDRFYKAEENFITIPLQKKIRDIRKFEELKNYMISLGEGIGQEFDKDNLMEMDRELALGLYSQLTQGMIKKRYE